MLSLNAIKTLLVSILLLALFVFLGANYLASHDQSPIWSDSEGYYMYLPATLIYGTFDKEGYQLKTSTEQFTTYPNTNKWFTKYTCGVAILQAPFFIVVHTVAKVGGYKADGSSPIYDFVLIVSAAFYLLLGLFLSFKNLSRVFSGFISFISLFFILTGSNLYFYAFAESGMSHIYSFFLFSFFIYLTPQFLEKKLKLSTLIPYALIFGLIVLIRPTNVMIALYPLLYNLHSSQAILKRFDFIKTNFLKLILGAFLAFTVFIPQFLYWKYISGNWIIYSYTKEGFDYWSNPKILEVLFSVQNGWLIYSPIMIFAVLGLLVNTQQKINKFTITLILIIAIYSFASWHCWYFGGAFGHRSFVEFYTFLSFGFANFIYFISQKKHAKKYLLPLFFTVCVCLSFYSLQLTYVYAYPWIGENWTWSSWWAVVENNIFRLPKL